MKKLIVILIVLVLIIGAGYLSDALAQTVSPRGALYFWQLFDTPGNYTGQGGKGVRVNSVPDALEFYTIAGGTDEKVGIDAAATAGYIGAAYSDGIFRVDLNELTYTDGGDFITLGLPDHATARTALGLAIGTDVEAYDAGLLSLAGLTYTSDSFIKVTANDTYVIRTIAETKTDLSLNNVENTALSSWAGTTNITIVGSIATGTWQATLLQHEYGGLEADVSAYTGLLAITGGATAEVDSKSELEGHIADVADFAEADGDIFTGVHDFGGADSFELPQSATPTTDATGEIALDTTITDHQPLWQYYDGGENMTFIAIDTSQLPALDNEIIKYDAATDKFVLEEDVTGAGGGDPVLINTVAITDGSGVDLTDGTGITITLDTGVSPDTATFALDQTASLTITGRWTFAGEDTGTDVIGLNVNWAGSDPTNGQTEGDFWYDSTLNLYKGYTTHEIILGSAEEPGIIQAKKGSGGTISAGDAVYITGFDGTDLLVELADADDAAKMPAIGIASATINSGTAGSVTTFGLLENIIDTGAMAVGDGIWITVTGTSGNTLTNTKPTGATTAIQRIATVASAAVSGELFVAGALRTNDESNLTEAYIFVGNANEYSTAVAMSGDVAIIANGTTTIQNDAVALTTDTTGNYADGDAEAGSALTGDTATAFFGAGTIEHERGGLEADINAYTGLVAISGGATAEIDSKTELEGQIADVSDFAMADGDVYTNNHDFGGADLELPQASPAAPDADGEIELDFTDGSVVIQHGSAHAELGAATDVVVGKLIRSFAATYATPDGLQSEIDNWPLKAIESTEFPHGIVITRIYLKTSASSTYAVNVENWDDPTTINGANPTIDAITTSGSTEATENTITYSTIAAGQIIMLDLPTTDISWFTIQIEYYEPVS